MERSPFPQKARLPLMDSHMVALDCFPRIGALTSCLRSRSIPWICEPISCLSLSRFNFSVWMARRSRSSLMRKRLRT